MSRPRQYAKTAEAKRLAPDALSESPEPDDDEQCDWFDDEPEGERE